MNTSQMESHVLPQNRKHDPIYKCVFLYSHLWLQTNTKTNKNIICSVVMVHHQSIPPFLLEFSPDFSLNNNNNNNNIKYTYKTGELHLWAVHFAVKGGERRMLTGT